MDYITVKELFKITKGKKVEEVDFKNENSIRYIQIDDLRNNSNIKYCENNNKYVIAHKEDIIIAWDGANAGTIGFGIEGAIGSTLAILRKENKEMDTEFCGLFLRSKSAYLREKCTGATIPHIQRAALEDIRIPKISLNKQIEIKNIINKAKELIDKRKEQIEALDELVKSQFIEMFGNLYTNDKKWDEKLISNCCEVKGGKRVPKGERLLDEPTTHPYLRVLDLKNSTVLEGDIKYLSDETYEKIKRYTISSNDVYLTNVGEKLGMAGTIPEKFNNSNLTENAVKLVFDNSIINKIYLTYYLNSQVGQKYISERKMIVGVPKLAIFRIETLPLILPPIELQNQFADFVEQVDKLKFEMEKSLKELEDNFNSLMQKAFNGDLFN